MLSSWLTVFGEHSASWMQVLFNTASESTWVRLLLGLWLTGVCLVNVWMGNILVSDGVALIRQRFYYRRMVSPMNIERQLAITVNHAYELQWTNYNEFPEAIMLKNNGSTLIMQISPLDNCEPYLCGGGLREKYFYMETIFKWGYSEHRIGSRVCGLEMQVLHGTSTKMWGKRRYLTVSYLFEVTRRKNNDLEQIINNLPAIVHANSNIELPPFDLTSLIEPFNRNYCSYSGVYDNGYCQLASQWFISDYIGYIDVEQYLAFSMLCNRFGCRILQNARSEMELGFQRIQHH